MPESDKHHSNFFKFLPPAVFSGFLASNWPGLQSLLLAAGSHSRMYAALPAASEVHSDAYGAYRAHVKARFRVCEYALMLDVINRLFLDLPTTFYFLPRCCSLGSRRGPQSGPWLQAY